MAYAILADERKAQHKYTSINKMCCAIIPKDKNDISTVSKNATAGMIASRVNLTANK
tara:strand:- start:658 stop:828 length:171 start_codon:yes stop_codon:yes gene_type:complete